MLRAELASSRPTSKHGSRVVHRDGVSGVQGTAPRAAQLGQHTYNLAGGGGLALKHRAFRVNARLLSRFSASVPVLIGLARPDTPSRRCQQPKAAHGRGGPCGHSFALPQHHTSHGQARCSTQCSQGRDRRSCGPPRPWAALGCWHRREGVSGPVRPMRNRDEAGGGGLGRERPSKAMHRLQGRSLSCLELERLAPAPGEAGAARRLPHASHHH